MKDILREYFTQMLEDGVDIEAAIDNMQELVAEIAYEIYSDEGDE